VEHLTLKCRCSTVEQIGRLLAAHSFDPQTALSIVRRLASSGMIQHSTTAVVLPEPMAPMFIWTPGWRQPNFKAIAWKLERRWTATTSRSATICWATEIAARLFGGIACFQQHGTQMEHDLGTASILIRLHETSPLQAGQWISEDILRRDYFKGRRSIHSVPDAAIVENGCIVKWIEYGGQYRVRRLQRLHRHCRTLPYELW
jgi:hypothetical protein